MMFGEPREREVRDLFAAQYRPLCRLAYVILGDSALAEEAVMDAFLKTFGGWRRISSIDRPDLYLRRAVVNGCNSRLRRLALERRFRSTRSDTVVESGREEARDVRNAVASLPARQRMCVVLRYFEDLNEAEMAEILQVSPGTIKSQLAKARAKLKTVLGVEYTKGEAHA